MSIIEAAAKIFNAAAASILLVNEEEQTLEFKVAYGAANRETRWHEDPLINKGIAGLCCDDGSTPHGPPMSNKIPASIKTSLKAPVMFLPRSSPLLYWLETAPSE
jgi:hypothetical protein